MKTSILVHVKDSFFFYLSEV